MHELFALGEFPPVPPGNDALPLCAVQISLSRLRHFDVTLAGELGGLPLLSHRLELTWQ